jgi:putative glycosyltransferase (TIGR04348 family)
MRIALATPVRPGTTSGNDVTAERWATHLRALGHTVSIVEVEPDGRFDDSVIAAADMLLSLHARRTATACRMWRAGRPHEPLVVALTGTDLYLDLPDDEEAMRSVIDADRLVVLQHAAVDRLTSIDAGLGAKSIVIHQSVPRPLPPRSVDPSVFRVVILAHLRNVKDPLLCARAAARLPADSTVLIEHAGAAHTAGWKEAARAEAARNPRYRWLGPLDRPAALELLASATVLACTSTLEGGANVVSEAIAMGVPVIGTDIDGNRGLLGADHPGLVPVGDDVALAALLDYLETDPAALADLQARTDALRPITDETAERAAWANLLGGLVT